MIRDMKDLVADLTNLSIWVHLMHESRCISTTSLSIEVLLAVLP